MGVYRTRTYIAADFDNDKDSVDKLLQWNDSDYWSLSFTNAHDLQSSYDSSKPCSIKKSLKMRMDGSKTFVLIVGDETDDVTKGGCQLCESYNAYTKSCARGYPVDYRSYIKYECDKAVEADLKIVVLYKAASVQRWKCPESVRYSGVHLPMLYLKDGRYYWNYNSIKAALED